MQPTQNPAGTPANPSRRWDGEPETDADRRFFDLRESGYTGWIDQDGYPVADVDAWIAARAVTSPPAESAAVASQPAGLVKRPSDLRPVLVLVDEIALYTGGSGLAAVTAADTLRGAALYLRRHGWHQRDMFDLADPWMPFPPACGLGGIRMASFGTAEVVADPAPEAVEGFDRAVMAFADHLFTDYGQPDPTASAGGDEMPWPEQIVADWNDAYDRNVSQVIAALQGAADQWDSRHGTSIPVCCGEPMSEKTPSAWVFPGDPVVVERVFHCPLCDRWEHVEVTDLGERDRLFSLVMDGEPDESENTPTSVCPTCQYLHADTEPCWFDACTNCGGQYTFGTSTSDLCGTCASATGFDGGDV